jgi:Cullin protein neddylation domain
LRSCSGPYYEVGGFLGRTGDALTAARQRKELTHAQLLSETLAQLTQFRPDVSMIKQRIESLIEREYLERMDDNKYKYVA